VSQFPLDAVAVGKGGLEAVKLPGWVGQVAAPEESTSKMGV
jgi:hypothetical protein